jgi:hypothetical protein
MAESDPILYQMIRDLTQKVDSIATNQVTRHEFEQLSNRIENFVLRSEFELNKDYMNEQAKALRLSLERDVAALQKKTSSIGKLPGWAIALIIAVIASVFGGLAGAYGQSRLTPSSMTTSMTTSTTTTNHLGANHVLVHPNP